jgi:glycosyltransferase involved in cell wall biosynthesis
MRKLAIVTSHPIQYNAPLFRLLAQRGLIHIKVFYTWSQTEMGSVYDPGFEKEMKWDIPLLHGYDYAFVKNIAKNPGSHHFRGIINPTLLKELKQYQPDAVLVYGWSFHSHLNVLQRFKKPIFFRGDSTLLNEKNGFAFRKSLRRLFLKFVYRRLSAAIYVGENNKQYFIKHSVNKQKLIYAPHCVDNDRFSGKNENYKTAADLCRSELNLRPEHVCFLYAGKLEKIKGVEVLIDGFLQIPDENARLIIAGNGALESLLKTKAKRDKRIVFLPFQNQSKMPILYRLGDVFVLPSYSETWGLSLNEAMACGCAVIASTRCGAAIDLIDNTNGRIFEAGNSTALSNVMMELMKSSVRNELKKNSQLKISNFTLEKTAEAFEDCLNNYSFD